MDQTRREDLQKSLPHALRAFRHVGFRIMYFSEALSLVGTWMQQTAQSWLAYRLTGSSLALGAIAAAGLLPTLVLAPLAGVLADRFSRKRIIMATQCAAAVHGLVLAGLTISGLIRPWELLALAIVSGGIMAVEMPARQTFVVDLVGTSDLPNALALNSSLMNAAAIAGPAIAGVLLAKVSEGLCFGFNGLSKLMVAVAMSFITVASSSAGGRQGERFLPQLLEGVRWAREDHATRVMLGLLSAIGLFGMPLRVLLPIVSAQVLHRGSAGLGFLMGAYGAGALAGSVPLAFRRSAKGLTRWMLCASVGLSAAIGLFSTAVSVVPAILLVACCGFCLILLVNVSIMLMQSLAPSELRARAMSLHLMITMGLAPVGSLFSGLSAQYLGIRSTLIIYGVGCAAAAIYYGLAMRGTHDATDERVMKTGTSLAGAKPDLETLAEEASLSTSLEGGPANIVDIPVMDREARQISTDR